MEILNFITAALGFATALVGLIVAVRAVEGRSPSDASSRTAKRTMSASAPLTNSTFSSSAAQQSLASPGAVPDARTRATTGLATVLRCTLIVVVVFAASFLLPGLIAFDNWVTVAIFAVVVGVVNTVVKPIVTVLALPAILFTLGLILLVINALMFTLAGWMLPGYYVEGFWGAFVGSLIVSTASWILIVMIPDR